MINGQYTTAKGCVQALRVVSCIRTALSCGTLAIYSDVYKKSCYALRRTIKQAKHQYRINIESYYTGSDTHQMWQGLKTIADYKGKPRRELNAFYARFEAINTEACMREPAVLDDCVIKLSVADVSKTFKHSQSCRARHITRTCTQSKRGPTGKCLH